MIISDHIYDYLITEKLKMMSLHHVGMLSYMMFIRYVVGLLTKTLRLLSAFIWKFLYF